MEFLVHDEQDKIALRHYQDEISFRQLREEIGIAAAKLKLKSENLLETVSLSSTIHNACYIRRCSFNH